MGAGYFYVLDKIHLLINLIKRLQIPKHDPRHILRRLYYLIRRHLRLFKRSFIANYGVRINNTIFDLIIILSRSIRLTTLNNWLLFTCLNLLSFTFISLFVSLFLPFIFLKLIRIFTQCLRIRYLFL